MYSSNGQRVPELPSSNRHRNNLVELFSSEEMKERLRNKLKQDGVFDKLKAAIRQNLACDVQCNLSSESKPSLPLQVVNWLIDQHLRRNGLDFTLSVFTVESGNSENFRQRMFTMTDILKCLAINPLSSRGEELMREYLDNTSVLFLWKFVCSLSHEEGKKVSDSFGVSNQTGIIKRYDKQIQTCDSHAETDNNRFVESHVLLNAVSSNAGKYEAKQQLLEVKEEELRKERHELDRLKLQLHEEKRHLEELRLSLLKMSSANQIDIQRKSQVDDGHSPTNLASLQELHFAQSTAKLENEFAALRNYLGNLTKSLMDNNRACMECSTLRRSVENLTAMVQESVAMKQKENDVPVELKQTNRVDDELETLRKNYKRDLYLWERHRELLEQALAESRKSQEIQATFADLGTEFRHAVKLLTSHVEDLQTSVGNESRHAQTRIGEDGHGTYFDTTLSATYLPPELQLGVSSSLSSQRMINDMNAMRFRVQNLCSRSEHVEKSFNSFLSSSGNLYPVAAGMPEVNLISPELRSRWKEYLRYNNKTNSALYISESPAAASQRQIPNFSTPIVHSYERDSQHIARNLVRDFGEPLMDVKKELAVQTRWQNTVLRDYEEETFEEPTEEMVNFEKSLVSVKEIRNALTVDNDGVEKSDFLNLAKDGKDKCMQELPLAMDENPSPTIDLDGMWKSGAVAMGMH